MANLKKCMKKICAVSLAALMLGGSAVTVLPEVAQSGILVSAASEGTTADGLVWEENEDGGVTITDYTGNGGDVVIPNEIDGKAVTEIRGDAFYGCTGLTSVTIPDSVTYIGGGAFYGCTGLTSVTIPDSVTEIGMYAFSGCTGLTSVTIPDSVTYIGYSAFGDCTGLTSVTIPDSVTEIDVYAFSGCTGLTSVTIPDSVTYIGYSAFYGCTGLTGINVSADNEYYSSDNGVLLDKEQKELICYPAGFKGSYTIPDSVTDIDDGAFEDCTGLTNITIPDSVTSIGNLAFYGCTGLTSVTIGKGVTYIGGYAFEDCTRLTSVTIPDSVTYIGDSAFEDCTGLTSVSIPDSVTEIGFATFSGCTGLTSVMIPDSVTEIGMYAFSGCTGLTGINVSADNEYYSSDNGVLLDKEQKELICCPAGFKGSYTIPNSVTEIVGGAFEDCTGLTSVTIGKGVTYIGDYAFEDCTRLISVTIPDGVTYIGEGAFEDCTGLTSVTIPDSVTEIGYQAFGYYWDENTEEDLLTDLIIFGKVGSAAEEYANENDIPFVALGNELSDTETNVTVTGDIGENTKLEVSELKPEDVQISGKKACAYYDISLTENGEKIQPNGNVAVKIPYKDGGENIEVYRINDDGTTEKMQSNYDGEYVTFITDHFSKYAIVTDAGIKGDTNNDGEVNIADALMISRYDAGLADLGESQLAVSDVNSDGEVNIADALMISRFDAGLIDSL